MATNFQKFMAFLTTVEYGSFTKAAEILHYSQSGISRMIQDLENEWNVTLLERSKSGVRLTSDGIRLLPYVKNICRDYKELHTQVDELNGLQSGIIRIGSFLSVSSFWLPNIIHEFQKDYPNIDFEFLLGDYAEVQNWILEGRVDCGFVLFPVHPELESKSVEMDEYLVLMPENHPLTKYDTVPIQELNNYPFLILEKDNNNEISRILKENDLNPSIRLTTWDDYAIKALVENNFGISLLPRLTLQRLSYKVETRSLAKPIYREIGFAVREWKTASQSVKRLMDYVKYR